jgi:hypothetical protein
MANLRDMKFHEDDDDGRRKSRKVKEIPTISKYIPNGGQITRFVCISYKIY